MIKTRERPADKEASTGTHILVADDDAADVTLIVRAFEGLHYQVSTVSSGTECIAYLAGEPPYNDRKEHPFPALLLLDISMPVKSGFEVLHWIRTQPSLENLLVVMLTGSDKVSDANQAYRMGADSFFVKPFDFGNSPELFGTVERLLRRKRNSNPSGD